MGSRTRMTSCPEAGLRILRFEKKQELRFKLRTSKLIFGARRGETSWGLRSVPHVVGSDGKVSIKLCLSLLMSKNLKLKMVIKSFVPEPISSVFGFRYSMNICLFHVFISWSYFWTWICNST